MLVFVGLTTAIHGITTLNSFCQVLCALVDCSRLQHLRPIAVNRRFCYAHQSGRGMCQEADNASIGSSTGVQLLIERW